MFNILGYFVSISVVIGLILGLYYIAQIVLRGAPIKRGDNRRLKIMEFLSLQPQIGLYIVKVDEQDYLISVSNRDIQQMTPLHPKEFNEILKQHVVRRTRKP